MKMDRPKRKARIYQEEAKLRQTSHWDWDYLPLKTLERLARQANAARRAPASRRAAKPHRGAALAAIAGGLGLLALAALLVYGV
jgi:hypothetical protein